MVGLELIGGFGVANYHSIDGRANNREEGGRHGVSHHTTNEEGDDHCDSVPLSSESANSNREKTNQEAYAKTDHEQDSVDHHIRDNSSPATIPEEGHDILPSFHEAETVQANIDKCPAYEFSGVSVEGRKQVRKHSECFTYHLLKYSTILSEKKTQIRKRNDERKSC